MSTARRTRRAHGRQSDSGAEILDRLANDPRLNDTDRGVWILFLAIADAGQVSASLRELSRFSGIPKSTLARSVRRLIESGWLGCKGAT